MRSSSSVAAETSHAPFDWVESMGGSLIVIPVSALDAWRGCTESGMVVGGRGRSGRLRQGLRGGQSGRRDRRRRGRGTGAGPGGRARHNLLHT
ncbi:Imm21 family immunity protein [Streptomyces sp. NPDC002746]